MDAFIEIIKIILPACITGLVTFLITKYNYHRNVPLDKLEITYNRLYYPLYCLVQKDMEIPQFIEESKKYLEKYKKYMDRSTQVAFDFLKDNPKNKKAYTNFKNNIIDLNISLRRRLGYLEPNVLNMYTYSAPREKQLVRILVEVIGIYVSALSSSIIQNKDFYVIIFLIFGVSLVGFLFEIVIIVCTFVWKGIIKAYEKISNILKES